MRRQMVRTLNSKMLLTRLNILNHGSKASNYFDLLRGIAAIYVLLFHLRPQLFAGSEQVTSDTHFIKGLYLFTSVGDQFVMAFFVLSGFLISSSTLKAMLSGTWSWRIYLTNRLLRLWIVLLPALLLTYVWDSFTLVLWNHEAAFGERLSIENFLGSLFFLQGIVTDYFGSNGVVWSLSFEFWYYILFPCLAQSILAKNYRMKALNLAILVGLGFFLGKTIMLYFLIWLFGALLLFLPLFRIDAGTVRIWILITVLAITSASMLFVKIFEFTNDVSQDLIGKFPLQLISGIIFAFLMYILICLFNRQSESWERRRKTFAQTIAGFSYSLYLVHLPIIMFFRYAIGYQAWQPDLEHLLWGALLAASIIVFAWLFSRLTEANTDKVKKWVVNREAGFGRAKKSAQTERMS